MDTNLRFKKNFWMIQQKLRAVVSAKPEVFFKPFFIYERFKMSDFKKQYMHPKWQRKRLKIFERDDFKCQDCNEEEKTLHVHHRYYEKGKDVWDYPNSSLVTLCCDCHECISSSDISDEGFYKTIQAMVLSHNLDIGEVNESLVIYNSVVSPKKAKVLKDEIFDLAFRIHQTGKIDKAIAAISVILREDY